MEAELHSILSEFLKVDRDREPSQAEAIRQRFARPGGSNWNRIRRAGKPAALV